MICRRRDSVSSTRARFLRIAITLLLVICHAAADSSNSNDESEDYQADDYNDVYEWGVDDPYLQMMDDAVRQELDAEIAESKAAENEHANKMHNLLTNYAVGFTSVIVGVVSAIFCTAIFLNYFAVDTLMRRYAREGMVIFGRIMVSVPDIREAMKNINLEDNIQNPDSYSVMTDDDSIFARSEYSGSNGSGKNDNHIDISIRQKKEQDHPVMMIGVHCAPTCTAAQKVSDTMIPEKMQRFNSKNFSVIVEYDDVTYHDEFNNTSSEVIRKRLSVMGKDIIESKKSSNALVKLYVLQDQPMSGYPCGEVRRSLRWKKRLTSNAYVMVGFAVAACGGLLAEYALPSSLVYAYIGLLFLQVPILYCFLHTSFSKIISERYLENGVRLPLTNETSDKEHSDDDKEKCIAALKHGTSFGYVYEC